MESLVLLQVLLLARRLQQSRPLPAVRPMPLNRAAFPKLACADMNFQVLDGLLSEEHQLQDGQMFSASLV